MPGSTNAADCVPAATARRLLMHAQGLLHDPARRVGPATLQKSIEQMGFVQLDTISTVERAHHLTLHARYDNYKPAHLRTLHETKRTLFEQFTHDASYVPTAFLPYWLPRFERAYDTVWWRERKTKEFQRVLGHVLERIEREGPLASRDFQHERDHRGGGWWDWKPAKTALEFLWRTGKLAVARREQFHKVYDLMERVHPEISALERPTDDEFVDWACTSALERLGAASPAEIAAFWNSIKLPAAREWCAMATAAGRVVPVRLEAVTGVKPKPGVAPPDWRRRTCDAPEPPTRVRLLSPFDPVIRDRDRARRLFGFEYRFEAFTPARQRRYGYYVLPVLHGECFVGRADVKTHRDRGELIVNHLYWEPGVRVTKKLRGEVDEALSRLASLVGAERWAVRKETHR